MSAAETLRGRWVRRNVDEQLRHAIFDARHILFMADVFVCGMNSRSLHGTERMREIVLCGIWMFPAFLEEVFFEFTLFFFWKYCWRHAPGHLTKDSRMDLDINRLWSTANLSKL